MGAVVENRVVKSAVRDLVIPELDLGAFIRRACGTFKDRTALIDGSTGKRYAYKDLGELSSRVAAGLWSLGFRPGHVAGLHCGTNPEMIFAFYGVVFAGGTVVLAKPDITQREVEYHFQGTGASILFSDQANAEKIRATSEAIPSVKTLVVFGNHEGFVPMASLLRTSLEGFQLPTVVNLNATAAVLYSTGTSGHPKPVMISHRNIIAQSFVTTAGKKYIEKDDVMLGNLPFTHVSGLWLYGCVFAIGAAVALVARPGLREVFSAIETHKVTLMFQFPTYALKMLNCDPLEQFDVSSLKKIIFGGSPLPSIIAAGIGAKFCLDSLRHGYGLTETFGGVTLTPNKADEADSVGVPLPMSEIKVVGVDTRKRLDARQLGEICVKGPTCSPGYLNKPGITAQLYDTEGFLQTGDIGYYSEDGYLFIVDRIKDLIKCMERQVAPAELEDILLKHPDVKEVVVVGVPHHEYGEAACAFVVLHDPSLGDEGIESKLRKSIEDQCGVHKHLHGGVKFLSSIPKSENGKYVRRVLRDAFLQGRLPGSSSETTSPV